MIFQFKSKALTNLDLSLVYSGKSSIIIMSINVNGRYGIDLHVLHMYFD